MIDSNALRCFVGVVWVLCGWWWFGFGVEGRWSAVVVGGGGWRWWLGMVGWGSW